MDYSVSLSICLFVIVNGCVCFILSILVFLLFFPLLFTLGWMSQFDTFVINVFEQIDMNVFGGTGTYCIMYVDQCLDNCLILFIIVTASTGLLCGFYAISRSVLSSLILVPLGYVGFYYLEKVTGEGHSHPRFICI